MDETCGRKLCFDAEKFFDTFLKSYSSFLYLLAKIRYSTDESKTIV